MRNPWGEEKYAGDWSKESDLWTEDLLAQVDHTLEDDGKFFMAFEDYVEQIQYTDFSQDVSTWKHAGFAVFADDEDRNRKELFGDGVVYNTHNLSISSPVE